MTEYETEQRCKTVHSDSGNPSAISCGCVKKDRRLNQLLAIYNTSNIIGIQQTYSYIILEWSENIEF